LLITISETHHDADAGIIERACDIAERAPGGQLRQGRASGSDHPLAVAMIAADLGMSPPTVVAAVLHETMSEGAFSSKELEKDFGREVATLVEGITKLDELVSRSAAPSATMRQMIVAVADDIRVLVIMLACKLHDARTWSRSPLDSVLLPAHDALHVYAPLAHRLGISAIRWELEDLAFAALYPKVYDEIVRIVDELSPERDHLLATIREQVSTELRMAGVEAVVTGRPKHIYSVGTRSLAGSRTTSPCRNSTCTSRCIAHCS
jgi:GTP pyrophosphokinase